METKHPNTARALVDAVLDAQELLVISWITDNMMVPSETGEISSLQLLQENARQDSEKRYGNVEDALQSAQGLLISLNDEGYEKLRMLAVLFQKLVDRLYAPEKVLKADLLDGRENLPLINLQRSILGILRPSRMDVYARLEEILDLKAQYRSKVQ